MRRFFLAGAIVALLASHPSLAQHGTHHGTTAPPAGDAPAPDDDLTDFTRAVLLQATPEQVLRFQRASSSLASARKSLHHARLNTGSSSALEDLSFALTDAQIDSGKFLASFSEAQRSGLKEYIRKFVRARNELSKQDKALEADQLQAATFEKLEHALSEMESYQATMGNEMGISAHPSP